MERALQKLAMQARDEFRYLEHMHWMAAAFHVHKRAWGRAYQNCCSAMGEVEWSILMG